MDQRKNKDSAASGRKNLKRWIPTSVCIFAVILFFAVSEATYLSVFGTVPRLTLLSVCATGFICGGRAGAVFGIIGGTLTALFSGGITFTSPIIFMLLGYVFGEAVGWFLSKNFPSFMIYVAAAGVVVETLYLLKIIYLSESPKLWNIVSKLIIPDAAAFILFAPAVYLIILGINRLFKGKDVGVRSSRV